MRKKKPIQPLKVKYEDLEQWDYNTTDKELMEQKEEKYASYIGKYLVWFSNMEHCLDIEIANIIWEGAHDMGYTIIKDLEMFQKIELFYNLLFPMVSLAHSGRKEKLEELTEVRDELKSLTVFRNKIAHARWNTLDSDGYVRVDTKTKKEDGLIKFRKFKITPMIMRKGIWRLKAIEAKLHEFSFKINE